MFVCGKEMKEDTILEVAYSHVETDEKIVQPGLL